MPAPQNTDHQRAMQAIENTGFVLGTQMAMAFQQVFGDLAAKMAGAVGEALASIAGGSAKPLPAPAPEVARTRKELVALIAHERKSMKLDAAQRDAAGKRLTPAMAKDLLAAAKQHLAGLPDLTTGPITDEHAADYMALAIKEDPRWAAWVGTVMPLMQSLMAPPG